jgi:inorganic pyrophosphatase
LLNQSSLLTHDNSRYHPANSFHYRPSDLAPPCHQPHFFQILHIYQEEQDDMKKLILYAQFILLTCIATSNPVHAEEKNPLIAEGFILQPGKYSHNDPDWLIGERNLYIDYTAKNQDGTVNAVIEIPAGTDDKWETDTATGHLFWELKDGTPRVIEYLGYPGNYGMIPRTLASDGDPLDILVLGTIMPRGTVASVKVVGVMFFDDGGNTGVKLLAVIPGAAMGEANSLTEIESRYPGVTSIVKTWFTNYKGNEGELTVNGFGDADTAMSILDAAMIDTNAPVFAAVPAVFSDASMSADKYSRKPGDYLNLITDSLIPDSDIRNDFAAKNIDGTVNAVIEIPAGTNTVWETCDKNGSLFLELQAGRPSTIQYPGYPCNYGMVPRTLAGDGKPLDILVMGEMLLRGTTAPVKVIGVMVLDDRGVSDDKLIAVIPGTALGEIKTVDKLKSKFPGLTTIIETWFSNYRGAGGGLTVKSFKETDTAAAILEAAIAGYKSTSPGRPIFKINQSGGRVDVLKRIGGASTTVSFLLPRRHHVLLTVYTASGRRTATLADGMLGAGKHHFTWNTNNVNAGCYIVKLQYGENMHVQRFPLAK